MEIFENLSNKNSTDFAESEIFDEIKNNVIEEEKLEAIVIAEKREQIIAEATKYIGSRYMYGSQDPENGFDCSGFLNYVLCNVLKKSNEEIPRSTRMIYHLYNKYRVNPHGAEEGDIVLFLNKSGKPYHGEFLTHFDAKNKEITCIGSASRRRTNSRLKITDQKIIDQNQEHKYEKGVQERTREYNSQKYLIIDTKKIMGIG